MKLDLFEETLVQWWHNVLLVEVGFCDIPEGTPHMPYAVLNPVITGRGYGTEADPECIRDYVFQMMWVGRAPRQARWLGEKGRRAWLGDGGTGQPQAALIGVEGATVLAGSRQSDSLGAIFKSPEGRLYEIVDTYRAKVE